MAVKKSGVYQFTGGTGKSQYYINWTAQSDRSLKHQKRLMKLLADRIKVYAMQIEVDKEHIAIINEALKNVN